MGGIVMMSKKSKLLISFLFLLSSNPSFQGMEVARTCCQALTKICRVFIPAKEKVVRIKFRPKSILKERRERKLNPNKKVTFSNSVEILDSISNFVETSNLKY